jgi:hypothetical protein
MKTLTLILYILSSTGVHARNARTIYQDEKKTEVVRVITGHTTILSFPTRPSKVVVGNKGIFAVEYVEADLAVTALHSGARSNLFVYLDGRRFGFDLIAVPADGDEIVLIRDATERRIKVQPKVKHE